MSKLLPDALLAWRNNSLAAWKWLLSHFKQEWKISDYPVILQKLDVIGNEKEDTHGQQMYYRAVIVNWWVLSGTGYSREEAYANLSKNFSQQQKNRFEQNRPLPRPGSHVPLEFASQQNIHANADLLQDFIEKVLCLEWAWISDESSLADFDSLAPVADLVSKTNQIYGVDISNIESGNISKILEHIKTAQQIH